MNRGKMYRDALNPTLFLILYELTTYCDWLIQVPRF